MEGLRSLRGGLLAGILALVVFASFAVAVTAGGGTVAATTGATAAATDGGGADAQVRVLGRGRFDDDGGLGGGGGLDGRGRFR